MHEENRISTPAPGVDEAARRSLTPRERVLLLDMWQRSGLSARVPTDVRCSQSGNG